MNAEQSHWYQKTVSQTFTSLNSGEQGLAEHEAKKRLEQYGYNELEVKHSSALTRFIRQFHNPLVYILLAACVITTVLSVLGEDMLADTVIILSVVLLNGVLGFFQEGKAENALLALQNMLVPECTVVRAGIQRVIPTWELVPGDVVVLNGGDKVPADLRLFLTKQAAADEAVLTGESLPVGKDTQAIKLADLSPGDQTCIAFSGTFLAKGYARGVVVFTAEQTAFGQIAALVKRTATAVTPLQKKIADFTRVLIIAILLVGLLNFILGSVFGYTPAYSFLASVSLIVAAIPEMLPMIVTAILALAATTMAKRNALIRRLPAAETLGCTTVICSDKTGTLTKNEMTVVSVWAGGKEYGLDGVGYLAKGVFSYQGKPCSMQALPAELKETLLAGLLCNDGALTGESSEQGIIGDPTEGALLVSAAKAGLREKGQRLDEIPFDSQNMLMATLHPGRSSNRIYVKGSPEKLIGLSWLQMEGEKPVAVDPAGLSKQADVMAQSALRVIALAYKEVDKSQTSLTLDDINQLTFLGLQGMIDPPREEALAAIDKCNQAGLRTLMITGDHALTAKAIAKQLGLIKTLDERVLTGIELARMTDHELKQLVGQVNVYARVAPEHKLRIAKQLQNRGEIVAMTGDGVNDAPALKAADIGVSMGNCGTEVSKEASSMVLTDDNFATIVNAVEEGRHAWNNLEKAILYTLPTNGGQALLVMGAVLLAPFIPLFSVRLPLEPVQILWVNLFDSVFLTMPLMMELKSADLLKVPPRDPKLKIANLLFLQRVLFIGLAIAASGFMVFHYFGASAVENGEVVDPLLLSQAQTAAFWAVLFVHLGFVVSARSIHQSAFTFNPFSNLWLLMGMTLSVVFHFAVTFLPGLSHMFRTQVFPVDWWPLILLCLLPGFITLEVDKAIRAATRSIVN